MPSFSFDDLTSPHYSVRAEISNALLASRDIDFISSFVDYVFKFDKSDLYPFLINLLSDILNEVHEKNTKWALVNLLKFVTKERSSTSKLAFDHINSFFMNPTVFNHFKSFLIKSSWKDLNVDSRMLMTKIISRNKFSQLSNLLVANFETDNKDLILETIKAFRRLNDRRGNRFIDDYLYSSDLVLKIEAVKTLGFTGSFFDGLKIIKFLNSENKNLQIEAISAVRKLIGNFSLRYLKKLFIQTNSKTLRVHIIRQLGEISSKGSFSFLIKIYTDYNDSYIRLETEHSLEVINLDNKSELLISRFEELTVEHKCQFAVLLDAFHSPLIEEYLHDCITFETNKLFLAYCLNLLSSYITPKSEQLLRNRAFSDGVDNTLKLYAYDSLLKLKLKANPNLLLEYPPDSLSFDLPQHQIYMTYLTKLSDFDGNIAILCKYLMLLVNSQSVDNRFRAISCFKYINNKSSIMHLVEIFTNSDDPFFRGTVLTVLRSILYRNPESLEYDVISILPGEVYENLNPYLISEDLLRDILFYLNENNNSSVEHYVSQKSAALADKISSIILMERDINSCCSLAIVALSNGVMLSAKADKKLKRLFLLNDELKPVFLKYLLIKQSESDKDFLISRYSKIMRFGLEGYLNKYLDAVL